MQLSRVSRRRYATCARYFVVVYVRSCVRKRWMKCTPRERKRERGRKQRTILTLINNKLLALWKLKTMNINDHVKNLFRTAFWLVQFRSLLLLFYNIFLLSFPFSLPLPLSFSLPSSLRSSTIYSHGRELVFNNKNIENELRALQLCSE